MEREEQIITEAKKYYSDSINCHNAFLHGVEWADEHPANVWHDASEEPTAYNWEILCEDSFEEFWVANHYDAAGNWDYFCRDTSLVRWAYINDLLPKTKEL